LKYFKEIIAEYYEFCEQLIEIYPNKDFLVKFCEQREEEYDTILQNYEENSTLKLVWEVSIAYYGEKSLYDIVTEKYGYQ